jgi:hypothetical protein
MPETISYPGRDALSVMAAQVNSDEAERRARAYLARSIRAALDTHAHDLDALARRLDVHDQQIAALQADVIEHIDQAGAPCAACGEPDAAHLLDPDNAEDWQPQHRYIAPDLDQADAGPTGADIETGRDLAGMAEADGAISDGADVPHLIAQALAAARAEGYAAGRNYGGPTPQHAPALPAWVTESTPCAACPEDIKHEHDDNGYEDDDGPHAGHAFEPEPVRAFTLTVYVAAPARLDADDVAEFTQHALEYSTAREAIVEALAPTGCTLLGMTDPEPTR